MASLTIANSLEKILFSNRPWVIGFFIASTLLIVPYATQLKIDASFAKLLPTQHEYIQTYIKHQKDFGNVNRIVVALVAKQGDIFTPEFFRTLKQITDEIFFIEGIERSSVTSIFTPNVRFTEIVEDGFIGSNVIEQDHTDTPQGLAKVKQNIIKAGIVGSLVAKDFSAALITAQLRKVNPSTGKQPNYTAIAKQLEQNIRQKYSRSMPSIDYHIIGFAKLSSDIIDAIKQVILFFLLAFFVTALLIYVYSQSFKLTIALLTCALVAVIWQLGFMRLFSVGIDPMSLLLPFLVFAIAVSHGIQMLSVFSSEMHDNNTCLDSAKKSLRRLLLVSTLAFASDMIGFIIIMLIDIDIIQAMAGVANFGIASIILSNLLLLPAMISYIDPGKNYRHKQLTRRNKLLPLWEKSGSVFQPTASKIMTTISLLLLILGLWQAHKVKLGDAHHGESPLPSDSHYNIDKHAIANKFSIGTDVLTVIVETIPQGCINYQVMDTIDRFQWAIRNVAGVQATSSLPDVVKRINTRLNEGNIKWQILPRNQSMLTQAVAHVSPSSGMLNNDCSVIPISIFIKDHQAQTIANITDRIKTLQREFASERLEFKLAAGNVAMMAATNEAIEQAEFPLLVYIFAALIALCLVVSRSIKDSLCIIIPLVLVTLLSYALMSILEIGIKVNTLPIIVLGTGIGIKLQIYMYAHLHELMQGGKSLSIAYMQTLKDSGIAVIFSSLTLATGIATWIFSPLKFQAEIGILLTFIFLANMLASIFLLPLLLSIAHRFRPKHCS